MQSPTHLTTPIRKYAYECLTRSTHEVLHTGQVHKSAYHHQVSRHADWRYVNPKEMLTACCVVASHNFSHLSDYPHGAAPQTPAPSDTVA